MAERLRGAADAPRAFGGGKPHSAASICSGRHSPVAQRRITSTDQRRFLRRINGGGKAPEFIRFLSVPGLIPRVAQTPIKLSNFRFISNLLARKRGGAAPNKWLTGAAPCCAHPTLHGLESRTSWGEEPLGRASALFYVPTTQRKLNSCMELAHHLTKTSPEVRWCACPRRTA